MSPKQQSKSAFPSLRMLFLWCQILKIQNVCDSPHAWLLVLEQELLLQHFLGQAKKVIYLCEIIFLCEKEREKTTKNPSVSGLCS